MGDIEINMISPTLTSESAKTFIQPLLPAPLLPALKNPDFEFISSIHEWDLQWVFHQESSYVQQLRHLREVQQQGLHTYDAFQAGLAVLRANANTGLYALLHQYQEKAELAPRFFWESAPERKPYPLIEGLLNAFEHGSNYCQTGNVQLHMLGGKHGALFLIENPRTAFTLPVMDEDELRTRIEETGRGMGLPWYRQTRKAFVGAESNTDLFRLLIFYPIIQS